MGLWNFYFLTKLYMYYGGYLRWDIVYNLLFAAFLLIPMPAKFRFYRAASFLKSFVSVILGLFLLWHDTWFPPPLEALAFIKQQGIPSKEYILSFLLGYYKPKVMLVIGSILVSFRVLNKFIKLTPFVVILLLLTIPFTGLGQPKKEDIGKYVEDFFDSESPRLVHFKKPKTGNPDFDIVILHICSLAWDDLREIGMEDNPFFKQFNYLFTNFNTATTYSGPAVMRILQANCGQARHAAMYRHDVPKGCFLFESLSTVGFEPFLAMNHDGVYGNFAMEIRKYGHFLTTPVNQKAVPIQQYMFDGSPVYDDYVMLEKWWNIRLASKSPSAALFYNTVSLHDGVHWAGEPGWWKRDRKEQYIERVSKFLKDMTRFLNLLTSSGRNVIVVFVPEHGMALRGSVLQSAGLRDIPLPEITRVPMGIKFIGERFNKEPVKQIVIGKPVSYLALSFQLSSFIENSPFKSDIVASRQVIDSIPITDFVSENMGMQLVRMGEAYYLYGSDKKWTKLSADQVK